MSGTYPSSQFQSIGIGVSPPANGVAGDFSGGSVTATGGTMARTLAIRAAEYVDVRDYGAVGDGTTDDTAHLQAAFNAAITANQVVWIPPGTYLLNSAISASIGSNSLTVRGAGTEVSVLLCNSSGPSFTAGQNVRINISGLSIVSNAAGSVNTGLSISSTDQSTLVRLENLMLRGNFAATTSWLTAISLINVGFPIVEGVRILMPNGNTTGSQTGIYYSGTASTTQYATGFRMHACLIQGGHYALWIGPYVQGVYVSETDCIANDYGVYWPTNSGANVEFITSNSLYQQCQFGIALYNLTSVKIANCLISRYNQGASPTWTGIYLQSTIYAAVTGNELRGVNSGTELGINLFGGGSSTVAGNKFISLNGRGISMQANLSNLAIVGNTSAGITGALIYDNGITAANVPTNQFLGNNTNGTPDATYANGVLQSWAGGLAARGSITSTNWQTQGAYIAWNYATLGEMDFINSEGGGGGGFIFYNTTSSISATPQLLFSVRPNGVALGVLPVNATSDAAAASAGVAVGGFYRNASQLMIRVT